eukprot:1071475-Amphidinium_carterae.3
MHPRLVTVYEPLEAPQYVRVIMDSDHVREPSRRRSTTGAVTMQWLCRAAQGLHTAQSVKTWDYRVSTSTSTWEAGTRAHTVAVNTRTGRGCRARTKVAPQAGTLECQSVKQRVAAAVARTAA